MCFHIETYYGETKIIPLWKENKLKNDSHDDLGI